VAQEKNIFAKYGLEGELLYINSGSMNIAYRYLKCSIESVVTMKRNRADRERIISKYMKITDPRLAATEFDFVTSLKSDYPAPTFDGIV
jgi:hypothetical protein